MSRFQKKIRLTALILALALGGVLASEAGALDLQAPVRALNRILGKKSDPEPARPATGSGAAARSHGGPAVPGRTATEAAGQVSPGTSDPAGRPVSNPPSDGLVAASDSSMIEALDEILLSPEPYSYSGPARRDPFVSLVGDEYLEDHLDEKTSLADYSLNGILWGEYDRFALVEDGQGASFIVHEGDRLGRFSVTRIEPDAVLLWASEFGVGRTERLLLTERKGNEDAREGR